MADDPLSIVRGQLGERIAELQARVPSLSPTAIYARMDAIRAVAAEYGMLHWRAWPIARRIAR